MQAAASRVRDHQVVFCGLEVLRLMGERVEDSCDVDGDDVEVVLTFMRNVAHRCLDISTFRGSTRRVNTARGPDHHRAVE